MKTTWKKLDFTSYLLLGLVMSFSFGLFMGVLIFILSCFGAETKSHLFSLQLKGIAAGFSSFIMAPVVMTFFGLFFTVFSYPPFTFLIKIMGGLKLSGQFSIQDPPPKSEENNPI